MKKITDKEQEILYQLRMSAIGAKSDVLVAIEKQKAAQLDFENAMLKLYLKYGLGPNDKINEATGILEIEEKENDEQESSEIDE